MKTENKLAQGILAGIAIVVALSAGISTVQADPVGLLPNGGFETVFTDNTSGAPGFSPGGPVPPNGESSDPGWTLTPATNVSPWQTTASDGLIEVWESGFLGVFASAGAGLLDGQGHFAELNANEPSTLFQDVVVNETGNVGFFFLHRGRDGVESLTLTITFLPTSTVAFSDSFSAGTSAWVDNLNTNAFTVTSSAEFGTYRFAYTSNTPSSQGNFLDNAAFGVNVVPEPNFTAALALVGGAFAFLRSRRRGLIVG